MPMDSCVALFSVHGLSTSNIPISVLYKWVKSWNEWEMPVCVCVCVFKFPAGTQTCYKPIGILLCSIIKQMPIQFLF
jgi:hypothetical protein